MDLVDAETGQHLELAMDKAAAERYRDAFDLYSRRLMELANRSGGRYVGLSSDTKMEEAIFDSLMRVGAVE
jgi:hypothetical protein